MRAPQAPSDEGAGFCEAKDWGRDFSLLVSLPPSSPNGESTSLIRGRLSAAAGLGIAKAFWNHRHSRWNSYTKRKPPHFCGGLCSRYLSSRAVARQVLSAQMSLTSVFGMGTGGPSPQSTPTIYMNSRYCITLCHACQHLF